MAIFLVMPFFHFKAFFMSKNMKKGGDRDGSYEEVLAQRARMH